MVCKFEKSTNDINLNDIDMSECHVTVTLFQFRFWSLVGYKIFSFSYKIFLLSELQRLHLAKLLHS
uniref:Uncharacterized protein n=1 Tax=Tetraselmis sp. GSL018 TaxID=582737 RepID=A0A061S3G6_9CHLO